MLKTKYAQDIVTASGEHYSRTVTLPKTSPIHASNHVFVRLDAFLGTVEIKRVRYAVRYSPGEQCWRVVGLYDGYYRDAKKHTISPELRQQILERDHSTCQNCGAKANLTIDHILPVLLGGETEIDNLRVLCRTCNSRKGTRESVEVKKSIYLNTSEIRLLKPDIQLLDGIQLPLVELREAPTCNRVYIVAGVVLVSGSYRKKETPRPIQIVTSRPPSSI